MGYEIFSRKVTRTVAPSVSFSKLGRIGLNYGATKILKDKAVEYVLLLWDKDRKRIALRPITKKDKSAYYITYAAKGNYSMFSAKTFLEHIGYDLSETRSVEAKWSENEDMLEIDVPEQYLRKNQKDQSLETTNRISELRHA